jgi:hypothetical protein
MRPGRLAAAILACALSLDATVAVADEAEAKRLFDEAKALATAGKWPQACEKLAASKKLAPRPVTVYRLADCHERIGRTASAYHGFLEAASLATKAGEVTKQGDALARAQRLSGRLSRIVLLLPAGEQGLAVEIDGEPLPAERFAEKIALDPGAHAIAVVATGKKAAQVSVFVPTTPGETRVEVPKLENLPPPPPPPTPPPAPEKPSAAWKITGIAVGSLGVVGIGAGVALGFSAKSIDREAGDRCAKGCDAEAIRLNDRARARGHLGTWVFAGGTALAAGGALLLLLAPKPTTTVGQVMPFVTVGGGGLALGGAF